MLLMLRSTSRSSSFFAAHARVSICTQCCWVLDHHATASVVRVVAPGFSKTHRFLFFRYTCHMSGVRMFSSGVNGLKLIAACSTNQ
jgi:predicted TIM-barrel fold metal-dependent hydrolase